MKFFNEMVETSKWAATKPCCIEKFELVGSALYKDNPNDLDFAVLTPQGPGAVLKGTDCHSVCRKLVNEGWSYCEDYQTDGDWQSIRKGVVNLIVTDDPEFYAGMVLAANVCAVLGLERKSDRVRVHRVIRDGEDWQTAKDAPMREGVVD